MERSHTKKENLITKPQIFIITIKLKMKKKKEKCYYSFKRQIKNGYKFIFNNCAIFFVKITLLS